MFLKNSYICTNPAEDVCAYCLYIKSHKDFQASGDLTRENRAAHAAPNCTGGISFSILRSLGRGVFFVGLLIKIGHFESFI